MSLFRRPKKPMQRRVFGADDEDDCAESNGGSDKKPIDNDTMNVDTSLPAILKERRGDKKSNRNAEKSTSKKTTSLLSFDDEGILYIYD